MASDDRSSRESWDLEELYREVASRDNVPGHIAIIMDGNGRWAKRRMLPRVAGHRAGRHAVRRAVKACGRAGVRQLTLYTFSQENWKRPEMEVRALWHFLQEVLASEVDTLDRENVQLRATGQLDIIPDKARKSLLTAIDKLADNDGLLLNLAVAYGGRTELVHAARHLAQRVADGDLDPDAIDEDALRGGLYSPEIPDPDLVVRTSGEYRLSNFLIWQAAYAEMYFTPVLWPDFDQKELLLAILDYQDRERRYGGLGGDQESGDRAGGSGSLFDPDRWRRLLKVRS